MKSRLPLALAAAMLFAGGAAPAQEPLRIEAQVVPSPAAIAFHPKSSALVLVRDGADRVRLLDFTDPARPVARLTLPAAPPAAFLPDGRIVTAGRDGMLRVWTETGRPAAAPLKVADTAIYGMAVSASGRLIATQDSRRTLRIVSLESRLLPPPISAKREKPDEEQCDDLEFGSSAPIFSPDERIVVFVTHCGTIAAVTAEGEPVPLDDADISSVQTMRFASDGKALIVRFVHQPGATTIIWPLADGRFGAPQKLPEPMTHREIKAIAPGFGPQTFLIALESRIQGLAADGRPTGFGFDSPGAETFAQSADGSRVAVSDGRRIVLYAGDGKPLAPAPFLDFVATRGLAVAAGGDALLAANDDGLLNLWGADGIRIGQSMRIRPPATTADNLRWDAFAAAFSATRGEFAIATDDGYVSVMRRDGTRVRGPVRIPGYTDETSGRAAPAPGADVILAPGPGDQTLRFYDLDGRPLRPPFALHGRPIEAVGLSADGATIATVVSGVRSRSLQLWSAEGAKIGDPVTLNMALIVQRLHFSPDGRTVLAASNDVDGAFAIVRRGAAAFFQRRGETFLGFLADGGLARTENGHIVFEAADGAIRRRVPFDADFKLLAIMPDGARVLANDGIGTRLVSLDAVAKPAERTLLWTVAEAQAASAIAGGDLRIVFEGGRFVAIELGRAARRAVVAAWQLQYAHFSPDGGRVVIDSLEGERSLRLYDDEGRALAPPIPGFHVAFPADGSMIAIGDSSDRRNAAVMALDRNGARLWRTGLGPGGIGRFAISRDGARIAAAMGGTIRVLDGDGRAIEPRIETGLEWIDDLAAAPDGGWLVLAGQDKPALHFFSASGARIAAPVAIPGERVSDARFAPDGRHVLTREGGGALRLWSYSPPGTIALKSFQPDPHYYSASFGFAGGLAWVASRSALTWFDAELKIIATVLLLPDGHLVTLADGRHCGAGRIFETRRAFRGADELPPAARDAAVDCAAVRAALGGR